MKERKNKGGTRKIKQLLAFSLLIAMSITAVTYASDWEGWTEDKKEEAWTVYTTTDWNEVSSLNFTINTDGSIASADIPDDFRDKYANIVTAMLEDSSLSTVYFDAENPRNKTAYSELLLAMGYTLYEKGNGLLNEEETDVCYIKQFINDQASIEDPEDSFYELFRRLIAAERLYCNNNLEGAQTYSIYSNDENLAAVIQGVLYGSKYSKENETYTRENADEYYKNNESTILRKWDGFADDVLGRYRAVRSNTEHSVVG